jgi:CBS domain-containing protein
MNVSHVMTAHPVTCRPDDSLREAAGLMWERDVGCLPVVDGDGRLLGILTDRDVCMSAFARDAPLSAIAVTVAMAERVYACAADDPAELAAHVMAAQGVRRLPVLDATGRLIGIVSLDALAGAAMSRPDSAARAVAATLAAVSGT